MTPPTSPTAAGLVSTQAREALLRGDRGASRRLAFEALGHDPSCDQAWLVLAALAPPARRRAPPHPWRVAGRIPSQRLLSSLLILLGIASLASFALLMAQRGYAGMPAEPLS